MDRDSISTRLNARTIRGEEDFRLVRNLLIETYPLAPFDWNWEIRRWDGSYHHREVSGFDARWNAFKDNGIRLWETDAGKLVAAVHPEGGGDAHLQIHPDYRHIEEEMIAWAEENLTKPNNDGKQQLNIFVYEYDAPRRRILEEHGFEKLTSGGVIRRLRFGNRTYPRPAIAEGYVLRTTRPDDMNDCQGMADLYNAAFKRDIHNAEEYFNFCANSPSYRDDLDLVAEAPDGSLAANVGMIYDEDNRYGMFEPVCTHPDHLRKGLASALMFEGLHRVRELGATDMYVGTGDQVAANALYESIGFTEVYKGYYWRKVV